ncbi:MAG: TlpA family protein disulfide reductase [Bacteroidales bacterium]|nr:TlpA family protein disulfide reductase [Bacteroidales bacterium]
MQRNSLNGLFRKIILILIICIGTATCFAQKKGYDIRVQIPQMEGKMLYLTGYYGDESSDIDSCRVKKGIARFKSGALLPDGFYTITQGTESALFGIVVEQSRSFTISSEMVSNSMENQTYQNFLKHAAGSTWEDRVLTEALCATSPNTLVSKYMKLETYGLDSCDQMESRLLRHPYFNILISKQLMSADITIIDKTIEKFGATSEIGKYYLAKMLKYYNMDNNAPFDDILVHLYDKYYVPNNLQLYSDTYERTLKRAVMRKRHTLIGAEIPHLEATNADGKRETTENPQHAYTVIWFWDPDCEDCQEETPILSKMYQEHSEDYDFEVFAHSLTADIDRWKRISKEWGLTWPNTCSEVGESNYDFIDYFSIVTTPCCLLIDKNHKIIMRQFSLEQLEDFFQNNQKNNE